MKNTEKIILKFKKGVQTSLIRRAIKKAGSQRRLSKFIDIPRRSIRSYKLERNLIPPERLNRLLNFLDLKIKDILEMTEKTLPQNWGQKFGGKKSRNNFSKKELKKHMGYIRSFKKNTKHNLNLSFNKQLFEFFGILIGDGCISKYKESKNVNRCDIIITADKRYEYSYFRYIKCLLDKNFRIHCYIYESKKNNNIRLTIRNKNFVNFLLKLGFPSGSKYKKLIIPKKFLKFRWGKLKYLIRGLFDTDGCIFAKKNENYKYPYICISTKSKKLITQLYEILRERNYPVYINNGNLFMKGIKNVNLWMNDIGTSNSKHKFKYEYWLTSGKLPARLIIGPVVQSGHKMG